MDAMAPSAGATKVMANQTASPRSWVRVALLIPALPMTSQMGGTVAGALAST